MSKRTVSCSMVSNHFILDNVQNTVGRSPRTCRRLQGWWANVSSYSDGVRFKKNFRITKGTFLFILAEIKQDLEKATTAEAPVAPEIRKAVCLRRLARGDYLHTVAELTWLGTSTVCQIVKVVSFPIVHRLWQKFAGKNFPDNLEKDRDVMKSSESNWQYPWYVGALDGCHIPIKCPKGGQESAKEYHNLKKFFSIVLMALVDAKQRFMWASSGFPGNSHNAIIFQSTGLYTEIEEGKVIDQKVYYELKLHSSEDCALVFLMEMRSHLEYIIHESVMQDFFLLLM